MPLRLLAAKDCSRGGLGPKTKQWPGRRTRCITAMANTEKPYLGEFVPVRHRALGPWPLAPAKQCLPPTVALGQADHVESWGCPHRGALSLIHTTTPRPGHGPQFYQPAAVLSSRDLDAILVYMTRPPLRIHASLFTHCPLAQCT